ncbi:MAG: glycosyltransferase family 87 protein [Jatrophihabitantaceae bacterium]
MLPSRSDVVAARASQIVGGAWGRHAGVVARAWWTPLRVVMALTCLSLLLGFAQKAPCGDGNWTAYKQYTHACYSDVVPLWSDERLDVGAVPYRDTAVEYPVLTGGFMWLTAGLTRLGHFFVPSWSQLVLFATLSAVLLALCALFVAGTTAATARRRPYDAAVFALSPLLVFHAFTNWDLLAMALASGALLAWSRNRPGLAGVLIGLGTAAKLYPLFLLVPLVVLAVRTRRGKGAALAIGTAAAAWAGVNVPVALAYHQGWWEFYKFSIDRATERSTLWAIVKTLKDAGANATDTVYWVPSGAWVAVALIAAIAVVVALGLYAPVKPRLAQLCFLVVLAFLITTKVWSPQYSLWLVPLLALARPRWKLSLVWQFTEILVWIMTLILLIGYGQGQQAHTVGYGWLILVLLARDAMLLAIAALIVWEMWHPELDVVRADGSDDPGGGEFDGAHDYLDRVSRVGNLAGVTQTGHSR